VLQSFVLYAQNALKLTYEYLAFLKKFLGSLSLAMRGGKEEGGAEGREAILVLSRSTVVDTFETIDTNICVFHRKRRAHSRTKVLPIESFNKFEGTISQNENISFLSVSLGTGIISTSQFPQYERLSS
jgi:hypothetical protein